MVDAETRADENCLGESARENKKTLKDQKRQDRENNRRVRTDDDVLRSDLLKLFEAQPAYTMIELKAKLHQPEGQIKEILAEMADYKKEGRLFKLKSTY